MSTSFTLGLSHFSSLWQFWGREGMGDIFVLVEHRQGKIRDITYEMLGAGEKIAAEQGASLTAVLLGHGVKAVAEELASRASRVLVVEDEKLGEFQFSSLSEGPLCPLRKISTLSDPDWTHRLWNGSGPQPFSRTGPASCNRLHWPLLGREPD